MRISDWSSDVCSSDLVPPTYHGHLLVKKPDDKKRHLRVVPAPGIEDKPADKSRIPLSNVGFAGDKGDKGCLSLSYSMIVNKKDKNGKTNNHRKKYRQGTCSESLGILE